MNLLDGLFLYAMFSIWILLFMNIVLTYFGYKFSVEVRNKKLNVARDMREFPMVSIMIPAHNEGIVIEKTLLSMINLNYPNEQYEVIVINDNSSDNTGDVIEGVIDRYPEVNIVHIETDPITGGRGNPTPLILVIAGRKVSF